MPQLDTLRQSGVGLFVQKFLDDRALTLASVIAWSLLNALMPLILGLLGLAGLVLRDATQRAAAEDALLSILPAQITSVVRSVLDNIANEAGAVSLISLGLFLWFGSGFFAALESAIDQVYHVPERSPVPKQMVALGMLGAIAGLLVVAVLLARYPLLWVLIELAAFQLLFTVLPNRPMRWQAALPGTLVSGIGFGLVVNFWPLYVALFGAGFSIYLVFGTLMLFLFWLYVVGIVIIAGVALNAFLEDPVRAAYLASLASRGLEGRLE